MIDSARTDLTETYLQMNFRNGGSQIMPTQPVCAVLENISRKEAIDILHII